MSGRATPEKALDAAVTRVLRLFGFSITRLQQTRASRQTAGVPDLYVVHTGYRITAWLELKAPKGRVSRTQAAWHATVAAAGGQVAVVHDVDELIEALIAFGLPAQTGRGIVR